MNTTERKELAMQYFQEGYNCAQAVILAFADLTDADPDMLSRIGCSFGGGMGRLREVCGSVSGMFTIAGLLYGYTGPGEGAQKKEHYQIIQDLAHLFEAQNGSIVCRELLGLSVKREEPTPQARTASYYKKRPCKELVGCAAEILADYLTEHPAERD